MNYWLKMARIRELFEELHPLNYIVEESSLGTDYVGICSYSCIPLGNEPDVHTVHRIDSMLRTLEECKTGDEVENMMLWMTNYECVDMWYDLSCVMNR